MPLFHHQRYVDVSNISRVLLYCVTFRYGDML
ncbi:hypothetical protein T08_255 [Trichinella sp. T8]|nr:hypothetical protein T08_255 [Trichinella sp. T8]